ncbi:MAG: High-affinity zinc uptake system ATP-binding protein ZnuC [Candidatus Anoxychlamydiales bacterium]|nr:High-affinity zinc uptake system ATP-binding protein ZnuC [Candidatus Anoxychlamydiales bacterium]
MKKLIEIKNLSFCYNTKPILKNINLTINENEFIGIIGPNGGGKTTLLKLIMGFYEPHSGTILINKKKPEDIRNVFGYVPQVYSFKKTFPISVLDVVILGSLYNDKKIASNKVLKEKAIDLLKKVGLKKFINNPFGSLSGGQSQRVLIARALISDPKILILDEPTANIDSETEEKIFDLFQDEKNKRTILMVNHNLDTVIKKVEKICIIETTIECHLPKDICEHFKLGLYHKPIKLKK